MRGGLLVLLVLNFWALSSVRACLSGVSYCYSGQYCYLFYCYTCDAGYYCPGDNGEYSCPSGTTSGGGASSCYSTTSSPTKSPTRYPTYYPTYNPTLSPTRMPSYSPSDAPTATPTTTAPTPTPTMAPTATPTTAPTAIPTYIPTPAPSAPTASPTDSPTASPSYSPTYVPSASPTLSPTVVKTYIQVTQQYTGITISNYRTNTTKFTSGLKSAIVSSLEDYGITSQQVSITSVSAATVTAAAYTKWGSALRARTPRAVGIESVFIIWNNDITYNTLSTGVNTALMTSTFTSTFASNVGLSSTIVSYTPSITDFKNTPTYAPSSAPSFNPTSSPTKTISPTTSPSASPSALPSATLTAAPTVAPTTSPTSAATVTSATSSSANGGSSSSSSMTAVIGGAVGGGGGLLAAIAVYVFYCRVKRKNEEQDASSSKSEKPSITPGTGAGEKTQMKRNSLQNETVVYTITEFVTGTDKEALATQRFVHATGTYAVQGVHATPPCRAFIKISRECEGLKKEYKVLCALNKAQASADSFCTAYAFLDPTKKGIDRPYKIEFPIGITPPSLMEAKDSLYILVTELGENDLKDFLGENRELKAPQLIERALGVVDVVSAMHSAGYAWLDIKPANFVIFQRKGVMKIKGIDVESAVRIGTALNPTDIKTTYAYMSPELAAFVRDVDTPAAGAPRPTGSEHFNLCAIDIWALGITLWEIFDPDHWGLLERAYGVMSTDKASILSRLCALTTDEQTKVLIDKFFPGGSWAEALRNVLYVALATDPAERPTAVQLKKRGIFTGGKTTVAIKGGGAGSNDLSSIQHALVEVRSQMVKQTAKMADMAAAQKEGNRSMQQGFDRMQATMFNLSERTHPTTFLFLDPEAVEATAADAEDEQRQRGIVERMKKLFKAASDPKATFESYALDRYYLALVCEDCGEPQKPPYLITEPKQIMGRIMPLAHAAFVFAVTVNTASSVGRVFGFPTPVLRYSTLQSGMEYMERMAKSSLDKFEELQALAMRQYGAAKEDEKGEPAKANSIENGYCAREFRRFLKELDPSEKWGGLSRQMLPNGDVVFLCNDCCVKCKNRAQLAEPPAVQCIRATSSI